MAQGVNAKKKRGGDSQTPSIDFDDEVIREIFGLNMEVLLRLLDRDTRWLCSITQISELRLVHIKKGQAKLDRDKAEAIMSALEVEMEVLTTDHSSEEDRELNLFAVLVEGGHLSEDGTPHWKVRQGIEADPNSSAGDSGSADDGAPSDEADDTETADEADGSADDTTETEVNQDSSEDSLHLCEPVWSEEDRVVTLGKISFKLNSKDDRETIMSHIRAANPYDSLKDLLEAAGLPKKRSGWFSSVQKGLSRILRSEIESLVTACGEGVTMGIILTGHGLDPAKMVILSHNGRVSTTVTTTLELPPVDFQKTIEFIKGRVLRRDVVPSEGHDLSEIFPLALDPEDVDWVDTWFTLTEEGAKKKAILDKMVKNMKGWNLLFRVLFMKMLHEAVFVEKGTED